MSLILEKLASQERWKKPGTTSPEQGGAVPICKILSFSGARNVVVEKRSRMELKVLTHITCIPPFQQKLSESHFDQNN